MSPLWKVGQLPYMQEGVLSPGDSSGVVDVTFSGYKFGANEWKSNVWGLRFRHVDKHAYMCVFIWSIYMQIDNTLSIQKHPQPPENLNMGRQMEAKNQLFVSVYIFKLLQGDAHTHFSIYLYTFSLTIILYSEPVSNFARTQTLLSQVKSFLYV